MERRIIAAAMVAVGCLSIQGLAGISIDGRAIDAQIKTAREIAAREAFDKAYAVLIDMSRPSDEKRLFVLDLAGGDIVYQTWVAHGKGSGRGTAATRFSNDPASLCTSLGLYKIQGSYVGCHGKSYSLVGLEASRPFWSPTPSRAF